MNKGFGLGCIVAALIAVQSGAALAQAAPANAYSVANKCAYPIRALVYLVDPVSGWLAHGWIGLKPGEVSKGFVTRNRYVYFYAESLDGKTVLNAGGDGQRRIRAGKRIYLMGRTNIGPRYRKYTKNFCG